MKSSTGSPCMFKLEATKVWRVVWGVVWGVVWEVVWGVVWGVTHVRHLDISILLLVTEWPIQHKPQSSLKIFSVNPKSLIPGSLSRCVVVLHISCYVYWEYLSNWDNEWRKGLIPTSLSDPLLKLKCGNWCSTALIHVCPNHKSATQHHCIQARTLLPMNESSWPFQILEAIHVHIHNTYIQEVDTTFYLGYSKNLLLEEMWWGTRVSSQCRAPHNAREKFHAKIPPIRRERERV